MVDGVRLAGTLTTPDGDGPFPGVVLVAGAGPHDRNGLFMGHRPLLVLAHHLTRAGVAVLRYDERGVGESEGDFQAATAAALVGDLAPAHALLTDDPRVDAGQIGILAHSEGGRLAIRAMDAHSIGA